MTGTLFPRVASALLLLGLMVGTSAAQAEETRRPCYHFRLIERTDAPPFSEPPADGPAVRTFCIPSGYFLPPGGGLPLSYFPVWQGKHDVTGFNLEALWPTMAPAWERIIPRSEYDPVTHGNRIGILLQLSTTEKTIEHLFYFDRGFYHLNTPAPTQFGLERFILAPDMVEKEKNHRKDMVILHQKEHNNMYILCNDTYSDYPGCSERIEYRGYYVKFSYSVVYIDKWKEIELKIKNLIDSFVEN